MVHENSTENTKTHSKKSSGRDKIKNSNDAKGKQYLLLIAYAEKVGEDKRNFNIADPKEFH